MSLSWRDRLLISLTPGELTWLRLAGRFKTEVLAKRIIAIEPGYGAHAWDGAIEALRIEATQWRRDKLSVRVVLSNHFVRYALVPSSKAVSGHTEELALARFHFQKIHGDASRDWDIRMSLARPHAPRLACAVDTALLDALRQVFVQKQAPQLESVQPLLMSVFNSGCHTIPDSGAWLVMAETDRACVALLAGKTWRAVQNVRGQFPDAASWIDLVERERWRVDLDTVPETLLIHATQSGALPPRAHGAWRVASLQTHWPAGLLPSRDGSYIGALSAA